MDGERDAAGEGTEVGGADGLLRLAAGDLHGGVGGEGGVEVVVDGVEAGGFVGVADGEVAVGEAVDVDVEEARGRGWCWDVLVVGGWGGRGALFGGEEDVGVGVGFEILGGWRAGRVADGVGPAVVRWWSGGVDLQMLLVGWIVGHCGMFDVSRENVSRKSLFPHRVIVNLME